MVSAKTRGRRPRVFDVVVVGAGLAGLTTADLVRRAGRSVVVLEARSRVGGRNYDLPLPGGAGVVEMGGEWTGPGQDEVQALARELGVGLFDAYATGDAVYLPPDGGGPTRYAGDIPPASPLALVELERTILDLNALAATVPLGRPWDAPRAAAFDRRSVGEYIASTCTTGEAQGLAETGVSGVYGETSSLISLLDLLHTIVGVGGDFNTLIGDAQSVRFDGGPQRLSQGLARRLSKAVRLRTEVVGVELRAGRVDVVTRSGVVHGRRVVLTMPRPVIAALRFRPVLPPAYDQLLQRQPMGAVTKVNVVYDTPFWRGDGLSGTVVGADGVLRIAYDNSPPSGRPGVLVTFFEGNASRHGFTLTAAQRRELVLAFLARSFGERARRPVAYHEQTWATETFTRGAYGTYSPPGVLTALGPVTDGPVGPIHFAGDGTSAVWPGYMDGAIRSGRRAAREVLAEL